MSSRLAPRSLLSGLMAPLQSALQAPLTEEPPTERSAVEPGTIDPSPFPTTVSNAEEPDYLSLLHNLSPDEFHKLFERLDALFNRNGYEVAGPYCFGGPGTGAPSIANTGGSLYSFASPFDTPAEWAIVSLWFGGAGQAMVGSDETIVAPTSSMTIDPTQMMHGIPFAAGGSLSVSNSADFWFPIAGMESVYLNVNVQSGKSAVATVVFRRKLDSKARFKESYRP